MILPNPNDDCLLILDSPYACLEIKIVPYHVYCMLGEVSTQGLPSELEDLLQQLNDYPTIPQDDIVSVPEFTCIRILRI